MRYHSNVITGGEESRVDAEKFSLVNRVESGSGLQGVLEAIQPRRVSISSSNFLHQPPISTSL